MLAIGFLDGACLARFSLTADELLARCSDGRLNDPTALRAARRIRFLRRLSR